MPCPLPLKMVKMTESDTDNGNGNCEDPEDGKYRDAYDDAISLPDLFEVVKDLVECELGRHRAGLMLGFVDMGISHGGFVGAYFVVGGNAIVVNRQALGVIRHRQPELEKPYQFYLLLHEFLHAVGYLDEAECRGVSAALSARAFGDQHDVTRIARNFGSIFRDIIQPGYGYMPPENTTMEIISGFDRSSVNYIM
jgi:hypothetical protein